ncbi:ICE family protease (Caspase) p20 domain-containing protein [Balamuthia mandrillaris]
MGKWKKEENELLESFFKKTADGTLTPQLLAQLRHGLPGRSDSAIRGKWSNIKTKVADRIADEEEAASVLPQVLALRQQRTASSASLSLPVKAKEVEEAEEEEEEEEEEPEEEKLPSPKRPRHSSFSSSSSSSFSSSSSSFSSPLSSFYRSAMAPPPPRSSFVPASIPLNAWLWYCCSKDGAYFFFRQLPGMQYHIQRVPRRYDQITVTIIRSRLSDDELSFVHSFSGLIQDSFAWQQHNHQLELKENIELPKEASDPLLWRYEAKNGIEATFVPFMKDTAEEEKIMFFFQ